MNSLSKIDKELIWHPFTPLEGAADPILIRSARGVYLHTHDGRHIIDAIASWWVNIHGHAHPYIADAMTKQANTLEHVVFAGFTHEPAIRLAQNLQRIFPGNQAKIFFSDNGSTAVEVALKIAMQYWHNLGIKKNKIVAIQGAYHGDTFGAMAVGERGPFSSPFAQYLFDVEFINFPVGDNEDIALTQLKALLKKGDVGAFIFEPLVQGAAGMRMYSPAILNKLMKEAKRHGAVCIADEVFTGFGRTGKLFACNYLDENPDIMAVSKGITGGTLPLGVTSCSAEIVSAFRSDDFSKTFFHGHSYTANPVACAAANASFDLLMRDECQNQIAKISDAHTTFKAQLQNDDRMRDIRSQGTILAIELNTEEQSTYSNTLRKRIYPFFLKRDILLRPLGNTIYMVPPYVIQEDELQKVYSCIEEFVATLP